jgi:hypothetical protein
MAEDFPGDYRPFGVDVILLIEWFSVVQLLGKSRKLDSHASLGVTQIVLTQNDFGNRDLSYTVYVARTTEREMAPESHG